MSWLIDAKLASTKGNKGGGEKFQFFIKIYIYIESRQVPSGGWGVSAVTQARPGWATEAWAIREGCTQRSRRLSGDEAGWVPIGSC